MSLNRFYFEPESIAILFNAIKKGKIKLLKLQINKFLEEIKFLYDNKLIDINQLAEMLSLVAQIITLRLKLLFPSLFKVKKEETKQDLILAYITYKLSLDLKLKNLIKQPKFNLEKQEKEENLTFSAILKALLSILKPLNNEERKLDSTEIEYNWKGFDEVSQNIRKLLNKFLREKVLKFNNKYEAIESFVVLLILLKEVEEDEGKVA